MVAGGETAGIPFAAFLAALAKKPMIYVRKQPKGFGRMAQIEGDLKPGKRVLLVEDLATDGGSKLVFIEALKKAEAKVTDCFVIFHYGIFPQSVEMLAAAGVKLHALATWWDALEAAQKHKYFDETRPHRDRAPSSRRPSNGRPITAAARPRRARCWGASNGKLSSRPKRGPLSHWKSARSMRLLRIGECDGAADMIRRLLCLRSRAFRARRPRPRQGRAGARHDPGAGHLESADQLDAGQVADQQHDRAAAHRLRRRLEPRLPGLHRAADHRERQGRA